MPLKSVVTSRRHRDGITRISILVVLPVLAFAAIAIRYLLLQPEPAAVVKPINAAPSATPSISPSVSQGRADDTVLAQARTAMREQRLLSPAGDNAFEWYLAVLQRQPDNRVAADALRETFPFAAQVVEQTISQGNEWEARRQIELLARADPHNYTLTILRTKLDAQKRLSEQAQQRAQPAVTPARTAPAVAVAHAANAPVAPSVATPPMREAASAPVAPPPAVLAAAEQPAAIPARAAATAVAPVLRKRVEPYYPADARRTRRQGWVMVQFTVQADGTVARASVVDAEPKNLFDHAAMSAVERWQYTPGMHAGNPVPTSMRQRIDFRL